MRFYVSSSEDEDEILRNVVGEIVETDYLGADESGESSNSSSTDSSTDSSDEDNSEEEKEGVNEKNKQKKVQQEEHVRNKEHEQKKDKLMQKEKEKQQQKEKEKQQQKEKEKQQQKENGKGKKKKTAEEQTAEEQTVEEQTVEEEQEYQVGDFVVAVYEGKWLLAQVDIDQDNAGTSHVNLTYMEKVGDNQFKWPKHDDLLLTLKEDILFRCTTPMLVGSSIRASHVGLPHSEALRADAALDSVRVSSAKCYCTYLPYWDLRYFLFL
jgi:hypothetical protein